MFHDNLSHILRKQLNQYCRHHIGGNPCDKVPHDETLLAVQGKIIFSEGSLFFHELFLPMQGIQHSFIGKGGPARRLRRWRSTRGALTPLGLLTTPGSCRLLPGRGSDLIDSGGRPGRGGGRTHSLGATGRGRTLSRGLPSHRLTLYRRLVRLDVGRGAGG